MPIPLGVVLFGGTLALAKYLSGRSAPSSGATPSAGGDFAYGDDMIAPSGDFLLPGPMLFGGLISPVPTTVKAPLTLKKLAAPLSSVSPVSTAFAYDGYNPDAVAQQAAELSASIGGESAAAPTSSDTGEGSAAGVSGAPAGTPGGEESAAGDTAGGAGGSSSGDAGDAGDAGTAGDS